MAPALHAIDHLLLGAADLGAGVAWVERVTGVKALVGGSHPGMGTRNALLSLGGRQYLEIIAPDPAQSVFAFRTDLRALRSPQLVAWAALATDIAAIAKRAKDAGVEVLGPHDGSRARPDGTTLRWKTLAIVSDLARQGIDPIPFFIEWPAGTAHPAEHSPTGCTLQSFELAHPEPSAVSTLLQKVGIDATIATARTCTLRAALSSPRGRVELS
jgi:hypothetical protein